MNFDEITEPTQCRLVVAFADLTKFAVFSQTKFAREIFDIISVYFELAGDIVESHGGKIIKFIGDAIYIVFPSNNVNLAVSTLKQLQQEVEDLFAPHDTPMVLQIKAHVGDVICGLIGTRQHKALDVFGDVVNKCAMLPRGAFVLSDALEREWMS